MAKKNEAQHRAHVSNNMKVGLRRTPTVFKRKGNAPARTSRRGNGSKIR